MLITLLGISCRNSEKSLKIFYENFEEPEKYFCKISGEDEVNFENIFKKKSKF